jgi:hypothetical protein
VKRKAEMEESLGRDDGVEEARRKGSQRPPAGVSSVALLNCRWPTATVGCKRRSIRLVCRCQIVLLPGHAWEHKNFIGTEQTFSRNNSRVLKKLLQFIGGIRL